MPQEGRSEDKVSQDRQQNRRSRSLGPSAGNVDEAVERQECLFTIGSWYAGIAAERSARSATNVMIKHAVGAGDRRARDAGG